MTHTKPLEVIIIGAGLAGLATAYGLQDLPGVRVRILEKRKEEDCLQTGYPIRLSPDGRQALKELLTPPDYLKLLQARSKLPQCHDGITLLDASGTIIYRKVDSPGERCLIERQDLIDLLKTRLSPRQAGGEHRDDVEHVWGKEFELDGHAEEMLCECAKLWKHVAGCTLIDAGEDEKCLSPFLDQDESPVDVVLDDGESEATRIGETSTVRVEYDKSVKAVVKVSKGWKLTMWDGEVATCGLLIGADGMFSTVRRTLYPPLPGRKDPGFQALPLTIVNFRTTSAAVRRWVKDPDGMNMVYGRGWSAALAAIGPGDFPSCPTATELPAQTELPAWRKTKSTSSSASPAQSAASTLHPDDYQRRPAYGPHEVYVALTLPHPRGDIHHAISTLHGAKQPGTFLADLLADEGMHGAQAFPLWSARRTCAGAQRAELIGDASHGMVPYCGAGASAGLKDAAELVSAIQNHAVFGGDLDFLLNEFFAAQKTRNDPVIEMSRRNLWLVQGDSVFKRVLRSVAFGMMERIEKNGKARQEAEEKLVKWKRGLA